MKVLCIKDGPWKDVGIVKGYLPDPEFGDILEVSDISEEASATFYLFAEIPNHWYSSVHFIPISDKEEQVSAEIQILELTN